MECILTIPDVYTFALPHESRPRIISDSEHDHEYPDEYRGPSYDNEHVNKAFAPLQTDMVQGGINTSEGLGENTRYINEGNELSTIPENRGDAHVTPANGNANTCNLDESADISSKHCGKPDDYGAIVPVIDEAPVYKDWRMVASRFFNLVTGFRNAKDDVRTQTLIKSTRGLSVSFAGDVADSFHGEGFMRRSVLHFAIEYLRAYKVNKTTKILGPEIRETLVSDVQHMLDNVRRLFTPESKDVLDKYSFDGTYLMLQMIETIEFDEYRAFTGEDAEKLRMLWMCIIFGEVDTIRVKFDILASCCKDPSLDFSNTDKIDEVKWCLKMAASHQEQMLADGREKVRLHFTDLEVMRIADMEEKECPTEDARLNIRWEKMSDLGFHSRADIPDHLREAVDRHVSDMFPGEMHNDLRSKLKEMWKTFFTSSMIRMGHGLVDQMRDMVSLLSIELKKQPCTCKVKEPETENVVGGSSMAQKDDANADTDSDDCLERSEPCTCKGKEPETENVVGGSSMAQKYDANADTDSDDCLERSELTEEEDVAVTALYRMLFADVLQAPRTYIEGNEKILEVGGKSVSWHSFYVAMKGGGFMDPSVMDVFLKCMDDGLDFLYIPSSLAHILDVDEADPIVLAASFAEHDLRFYNLNREEVYITCCDYSHWWVIFVDFHFRKFRVSSSLELTEAQMASTERIADIESFRQFFAGVMLTYDSPGYLASFVSEHIEEFKNAVPRDGEDEVTPQLSETQSFSVDGTELVTQEFMVRDQLEQDRIRMEKKVSAVNERIEEHRLRKSCSGSMPIGSSEFSTKLSLPKFNAVCKSLSPKQRGYVADIGQGSLLDIRLEEIPRAFVAWIVLGTPIGGRRIPIKCSEQFRDVVRNRSCCEGSTPTINELMNMMSSDLEEEDFKRYWMMFSVTAFLCPTTYECVSPDYLSALEGPFEEIRSYDWSSAVFQKLSVSMKTFVDCGLQGALCGCLVVPLMTYLEYLDIKVKELASVVPRISVWDSETAVDDLKEIQQSLYFEIFSAIQPIINNKIANVLQLASHYNEQRLCASEDKQGGSCSRPWFSNMANCLGILNDFDHIYRSNGTGDSPSVVRTESNQEGSVLKDQTYSLPESQNRNQGLATNAEMCDDMWREQIMPISQNVYKQIRLLQQLIPINCKYMPNALYKEYLLNLEAYLDRVMEDLPSKLPTKGALDLLVQKGVVCSCCGLLNSPLACETCNCSVAGDTDKNALDERLNMSSGTPLKVHDNVREVDAAVANEGVLGKTEGDFPESTSKGSGSAACCSGATTKTCKVDSLACVTADRVDCKDGSSGNSNDPTVEQIGKKLADETQSYCTTAAEPSINPIAFADEHAKVSTSNNPVIGPEGSLPLPSSKRNSSESLGFQHDSSAKKQKMSILEEGSSKMASEADQTSCRVPCDPLDEPSAWEEIEKIEKLKMLSKKKFSYSSSSDVLLPEHLVPAGSVCMTSSGQHQYLDGGPGMLQSSQPGLPSGYQGILRDRNAKTFHGGPRSVNFADPPASQVMISNNHGLHLSNSSSSQAVNPPARTISVSGLSTGFAGYGHDRSIPYEGSSFQSSYNTRHNSSYNTLGQQTFQSSQSAGQYNSGQHDDEDVGGNVDFVVPPFPEFMIRSPHVRATPQYHQNSYGQQQVRFNTSLSQGTDNRGSTTGLSQSQPLHHGNHRPFLSIRDSTQAEIDMMEWVRKYLPTQFARSPRIVETRGRWATHRNFGLSMQPGGYVHDYVMNVFAATVMEEQYDNSVFLNQRRPQCLKYIMYSESVDDSGPQAMKVILQHCGGFQHKIRENDVIKLREQLAFYMIAFQEAARYKARFLMDSGEASKRPKVEEAVDLGEASKKPKVEDAVDLGEASKKPKVEEAVDLGEASKKPKVEDAVDIPMFLQNVYTPALDISRITMGMLGIDVGRVDTIAEATFGKSSFFTSSFVVAHGLNKFLGHSKFLAVENFHHGSVLVKFQDTSDLQKVDGMVFKYDYFGPFHVKKVYYVEAQPTDYAELLDAFVSNSNF
ncbi:hypothetical protein ACQ4PT_069943 [Festuca glaucescens]